MEKSITYYMAYAEKMAEKKGITLEQLSKQCMEELNKLDIKIKKVESK